MISEVKHPTDIPVGNHAGHFQLIAEAFYGLLIRSDLWFDEF